MSKRRNSSTEEKKYQNFNDPYIEGEPSSLIKRIIKYLNPPLHSWKDNIMNYYGIEWFKGITQMEAILGMK